MKKIEHSNIKKGDIWIITNPNSVGHMQKGMRPHVIVTQITGDTVTVAPCTSIEKRIKYAVEIIPSTSNGLDKKSFVLLSQSFAADTSLLENKIGRLNENDILRIQLEYVKYVTD